MSRYEPTPYEVRCPRCDVSFPVETRRCIHCGGPTSAAGASSASAVDPAGMPPWIRTSDEGSGPTGPDDRPGASGAGQAPGAGSADRADGPEEAPSSLVSTLLRTFGSLFWVIALVAFSILRSCGEGE